MAATQRKRKRKTNSSGRSSQSRSNSSRTKKQSDFPIEITAIIMFAFSIFLFLCNFGIVGKFGNALKGIMFGLFGVLSYILPFCLFAGIIIYILNKNSFFIKKKIFAGAVLLYALSMMIELFSFDMGGISDDLFKNLYKMSADNFKGGGLLAGLLTYLLYHYLAKVGTILVIAVIIIICLVFLSEKSFVNGVKKSSEKVYESARKEAEYIKQKKEERIQSRQEAETQKENQPVKTPEVQQKRVEKKFQGVMQDTKIETPEQLSPDVPSENLHEIILNDEADYQEEKVNAYDMSSIPEPKGMTGASFDTPTPIREQKQEPQRAYVKAYEPHSETKQPVAQTSQEASQKQMAPVTMNTGLKPNKKYILPPTSLLSKTDNTAKGDSPQQLKETALKLQKTLEIFGVKATITDISKGPAVTRYELQPEIGTKVSKIVSLSDDIKLNLAATDIRIEAPIPGKAAVGIEIPNKENTAVGLRELLESVEFKSKDSNIAFAVGKDLSGQTVVTDIAKMLHVLIAGATGSGKSVCINTLIMSILYKANPDDVKFIMIDPKVVELSVFNGIPHLLLPVVTDPKKAAGALHWGVEEMTRRYQLFADYNVKDLAHYNAKIESMKASGEETNLQKLPQIIIVVDELADLMMVAQQAVEESICRLAQLARAAGIHLIIATQRPSVDVITGLIKANMPSRIAFSVTSGVDSRTILDMNGAEKLLGKGDMLFFPTGYNKPVRIQGAFVSDKEVVNVVDFIKNQGIIIEHNEDVTGKIHSFGESGGQISISEDDSEFDPYFVEAGKCIIEKEKASIGMLQRALKIGFNRAARIMDQLSDAGVVSEEDSTKPRRVLMTMEQFNQYVEENL